ncbi:MULTISPECIES: amino acid ABC transporter permease [unclassified Marinobacterium]|jgi:general L-amino acid transport system permease protein|uniref:amino acid ABC transporter permease n=1 Tax=unclassified Marinobacterium TaxID=2644139 RepID=UPI001568C62F|nr:MULTISPECIES: amino acid ABC transporter permease [unclassified Marinobacterium]NRP08945.1 putative glutamine ABC transporter permease protein GlnM [Marinobacterium sp. xm-g-48]NRP15199.1 putative glutamine ABC transporter permease protein GlnM [Marinobacterium sp. xm-a-152]NRP28738.1 putative glutamine ABC transporter permease protein GlnM [Marinobacterium sp. xm-d-420]NRP35946.1 putative glutamine ABC transporter permease protein GlnM [Marinobacterium sp. xm-d-579]NRP39369.1 putative glut
MFKQKTIEEVKSASRKSSSGTTSNAFYNNPRIRGFFYQIALVAGLLYFFGTIIGNTLANMEATGIKTGFDFLGAAAGYDVLMSLISFESTDTYGRIFVVGFLNTLLVSAIGIFFATLLGFIFGVAHFSHNWLIRKIALVYVEIFRNVPLLLQVFFWYFAVLSSLPGARQSLSLGEAVFLNVRGLYLPKLIGGDLSSLVWIALGAAVAGIFVLRRWAKKRQELTGQQFPVLKTSIAMVILFPLIVAALTGFPFTVEYPALKGFNYFGGITVIPELMSLAIALSVYTGAFIAEAVRAGVQSIPHGQTEAARSIGLRENKIMSLIIVPQAMRVIVPLLNSEYQSLVKNSTLAAAVGYPDLFNVFVGTALNQTGQAIETIFMTIIVYFVVNMVISFLMNRFNSAVALVSR